MSRLHRSHRAFTLVELLVVIGIIALLMGLLLPVIAAVLNKSKRAIATQNCRSIEMALEAYRADFDAYPPDYFPSSNGSEVLFYHLCRIHRPQVKTSDGRVIDGESRRGTYLDPQKFTLAEGTGGRPKLVSPYGGEYSYSMQVDSDGQKRRYILIDPGADKILGGQLSATQGFVSANADQNRDGHRDDEDNIGDEPTLAPKGKKLVNATFAAANLKP